MLMVTPSFQGFRSVVENSPDAITVVNVQKVILYVSSSITGLLGYEPRELVGTELPGTGSSGGSRRC